MPADPTIYRSIRMAQAYASSRPPVHRSICRRFMERISAVTRISTALDAGCGAGASTAALLPHLDRLVGLDPSPEMIRQAAAAVTGASFVLGRLEALPFETSTFQLVSTAGALNYADVGTALAEIHRVLVPNGWLAAYDFSGGQRLSAGPHLGAAHAEFRARFPSSPGYALELKTLAFTQAGLARVAHDAFSIEVPMTTDAYVRYLLGDSGVEMAVHAGANEIDITKFCLDLFSPIFGAAPQGVLFEAQLVLCRKPVPGSTMHHR
jgi:SAM-dependent methyltransferase